MTFPSPTDFSLADAICQHLADAVAIPPGHAASTTVSDAPAEGWHVRLAVRGRGAGYVWIGLSSKDVVVIARRILGLQNEDLDEGVLRDTIRELVGHAASGVATEPVGSGLEMQIEAVEMSLPGLPSLAPHVKAYDIGEGVTITLAAWSPPPQDDVPWTAPVTPRQEPARNDRMRSEHVRTEADVVAHKFAGGPENLDLVLDIDLPMSVRFGRTEMALAALTRLGPGSVIDLGRSPDEPVEMIVSGRVVARGDVVVVGGNFGVRITDVLHAPAGRRE